LTDPIQSVRHSGASKRVRGGRRVDDPAATEHTEAAAAPAPAAPIPAASPDPGDSPPAISAQILGQSDPAETGAPAKTAQKARAAYLGVEWSGPADRRNRQGRIAKTEI
jgi:hypothetical protein